MKYLEALQRMSGTLAESSDLSVALSAVTIEIATLFDARYVHVLTIHEGLEEHLRLIASDTASARVYEPLAIKERYRQVVEMLMAGSDDPRAAIILNDAATTDALPPDSRARLVSLGGAHHAIIPLLAHGVLAGALGIVRGPDAPRFIPRDAQVAEVIAAVIAAAIVMRLRADELDRFFTTSLDLLAITNAAGVALRLNPEWEHVLGRSPDQLVGTRLLDYVHPDDVADSVAQFAALGSGPSVAAFTSRLRHADGSFRWLEWRAQSAGTLIYWSARDSSERRAAEETLRRRIAELSALQRISATLAGSTDLLAALPDVAGELCRAIRALHIVVFVFDEGVGGLHAVASDPSVAARCEALAALQPLEDVPEIAQVRASGKPLVVSTAEATAVSSPLQACLTMEGSASVTILPLYVRAEMIGTLQLARSPERDPFLPRDLEVADTAGAAIAAAIGHERLRAEERSKGATAMRDSLARDLHDAVTQSVYAANLIAEALPSVWERNPDEGRANLLELQHMVQAALAELRKLLHELRPATLAVTDIGHLMERLIDSLEGQTQAEVTMEIQVHATPPEEVKAASYRIAQEAFNNVAKHSRATTVEARMLADSEGVVLSVRDNGVGFEPESIPANHIGLDIMHERAAEIGADVEVESAPGTGTQIIVSWPSSQEDGIQHEGGEAK